MKVIFGHPFSREELIKKAKKESGIDDYEIIARSLRDEVLRLKEETDKNDKEKDFFRRSGN
ncbi:MAG: hypothetical protein KKH04_21765 [Proteobacteria bacterium]|nr:hypothetical protein [Pseudomonadota bacterium]